MFIKQFDIISPRVTFYHQGFLSHSSIFSGVLSIISIILIFSLGIYYFLEILYKEDPNSFYFHSFIEDAPTYEINSSSLFHFINIAQNSNVTFYEGIDFTTFRIIGFQRHYTNYLRNNNLKKMSHWLYGYCENETDTEGISNLITYDFFGKTACIKKFYNSIDQRYYDKGDPNFKWPEIAHGTFQENYKIYNIIVERCKEDTIGYILGEGYHCRNDTEMIKYFRSATGVRVFHFYFVNNYINVLDYKNPKKNFIYRLESIFSTSQYSINEIGFNPNKIKTHDGLIFNNIKEEISYSFEKNDVYIEDKGETDLFMVYSFLLKNIMNYYERSYRRIQDIFSSIGGIYNIVIIFATYLNSLYNEFVVLSDTHILLHNSIYNEKNIFEDKNKYNKKFPKNIKELEKKMEKEKERDKEKKNKDIKNSSERKIFNNSNLKNNRIDKSNNDFENTKSNSKIVNASEEIRKKFQLSLNSIKETNNLDKESKKIPNEKYSFCNYFLFKITCGKKNNYFNVYKHFRMKIISEEHLIRNHLNIYNLLRVTERKRATRRNSYQLKDLIKLI